MEIKLSSSYFTKNNIEESLNLKKIVILLVDDEFIIRNAMKRIIIKQFNELNDSIELCLIEACDGIECLLALYLANQENIKINAIISDENMPFISGSSSSNIIKDLISKGWLNKLHMYISSAVSHISIQDNYSEVVKKIYSKPIDKNW